MTVYIMQCQVRRLLVDNSLVDASELKKMEKVR